jgi:hypothetical protein
MYSKPVQLCICKFSTWNLFNEEIGIVQLIQRRGDTRHRRKNCTSENEIQDEDR